MFVAVPLDRGTLMDAKIKECVVLSGKIKGTVESALTNAKTLLTTEKAEFTPPHTCQNNVLAVKDIITNAFIFIMPFVVCFCKWLLNESLSNCLQKYKKGGKAKRKKGKKRDFFDFSWSCS